MAKIKVLIVDDAVVVRQILADLLAGDAEIEVVGTAANGRIALQKIPQLSPDLITLDVEMPEMDGITTLKEIRKISQALPVIMFSTLTERGAAATIDALSAGASDYVTKPANVGSVSVAMQRIREQLIPKIKMLVGRAKATAVAVAPVVKVLKPIAPRKPSVGGAKIEAIAIGVSTGGPNALSVMIPGLIKTLAVPVFIVQHMPPMFTKFLADRLAASTTLKVVEATNGEVAMPGCIYVAPGDFHMLVSRRFGKTYVELNQEIPENSCRPAVDPLFRSIAKTYGSNSLAVVLTGMGFDGTRGCEAVRAAGGKVIVQDQATAVVGSMPGSVANAGLADGVFPLDQIATQINRIVSESNSPARAAG